MIKPSDLDRRPRARVQPVTTYHQTYWCVTWWGTLMY